MADGDVDKLPSSIDIGLDHTGRVAQLLERMLTEQHGKPSGPGDDDDSHDDGTAHRSVSTDEALHERVRWLVDAYGDRFCVPLSRRRLELLRLLVRAGNSNRLPSGCVYSAQGVPCLRRLCAHRNLDSDAKDPLAMPVVASADAADRALGSDETDEAASDSASRRASSRLLSVPENGDIVSADDAAVVFDSSPDNMLAIEMLFAELADPDSVHKRPHELLVSSAYNALCDVRRQLTPHLAPLSSHDLVWNKAMTARLPPRTHVEKSLSNGGRSALTRSECELMQVLQKALALQRLAVLRRFKSLYNVQSAPAGSLAANVDLLEELISGKKERLALLREAVLDSTRHYHASLAPDSLLQSVDGMMALHVVIRTEIEEDESYERSFPSSLPYMDIVVQHYIQQHARAFARFTEEVSRALD